MKLIKLMLEVGPLTPNEEPDDLYLNPNCIVAMKCRDRDGETTTTIYTIDGKELVVIDNHEELMRSIEES